jgi:long-chain fatty acid transport protein
MSCYVTRLVLAGCLCLLPATGWAQGHMLPGAGPINSAMGGAGVAVPNESLGALMFNPALIAGAQGNQVSFATEFAKDSIQIDTTIGPLKGRATPTSQVAVYPTFGWMLRDPKGKLALGFGLIGIGGFATDYPSDSASLLFAPVPYGFGRIFTDYRETKIPVAFAYQVTPKLALGASLNVYLGSFAVAPLPYKYFDTSISGQRYYPGAGKLTNSWAVGAQFGFYYQANPMVSVGGSVTTPQNFSRYRWNSTYVNPSGVEFGQPRNVEFDLDGPMIVSFGLGLKPGAKTSFAIDGMFTKFKGVNGLGGPGGVVDGVIDPFGWRSVWTIKAGVQHQVTEKLTVRAGYNYSQTPLRSEVILSGTGAPLTFQQHFSGGFGFKMFPFLEMVASAYFVPREHVVGPFTDQRGNAIGTLDMSNKASSALIGMNFRF